MAEQTIAEARFRRAVGDFYRAGLQMVDAWDDEDFHADERFDFAGLLPMSLDEWLVEFRARIGEEN